MRCGRWAAWYSARRALSSDRRQPITTAARLAADDSGGPRAGARRGAGGVDRVLESGPRVRRGQPGQDPAQAPRGRRSRGPPRHPRGAAGRRTPAGRPADRPRLRGVRVEGRRPRLHRHVPGRHAVQRRGDAASRRRRRPAIADTAVTKLRQLPPSIANVLVVAVDRPIAESEIAGAMRALRAGWTRATRRRSPVPAPPPARLLRPVPALNAPSPGTRRARREPGGRWRGTIGPDHLEQKPLAAVVAALNEPAVG